MEAFSHDEISQLRNIFALMDCNGCGKISIEEMKQLLNCQRCYPNETELGEIVAEIDFDRDGGINFEDFATYCSKRRSSCSEAEKDGEIRRTFDFMDHNGDGYISVTDVKHVMRVIGQDVAEEQVEQMLVEIDEEGSGLISYECFKYMMLESSF